MMPRVPYALPGRMAAAVAALVAAGLCLTPGPVAAAAPVAAGHVLFSFSGTDGAGPLTGVITGPHGVLYGTTVFGGRHGNGTVFSLTPKGSGYTERVLVSFGGAAGSRPDGIVADAHGDLFGTTTIGGAAGAGVVFELVPGRSGSYTERVLHSFGTGVVNDGLQPAGTPVLDAAGDVFGVTQFGGTGGQGVVYEMKHSASGYTPQVRYNFASTGGQPQAGVTMASNGALYGTLYGFGQVNQDGTVFRIQLGKTGAVYTPLYNFAGGADGANPFGALTVDNHTGVIYGTTQYGGSRQGIGNGTVFALTPHGSGYTERVLHALGATRGAGFAPEGTLLREANGDLIGTASLGGIKCGGIGCGTIFELAPAGKRYTFRVIYHFTGPPDGADPQWSGLAPGPGGTLIGTTRSGGTSRTCADGGPGGVLGCGTVYEITP
jgi:uncharacterized repeat protein (TIGR03803 family)